MGMINADATRRTTDSAFTGDRKEIAASLFRLGGHVLRWTSHRGRHCV